MSTFCAAICPNPNPNPNPNASPNPNPAFRSFYPSPRTSSSSSNPAVLAEPSSPPPFLLRRPGPLRNGVAYEPKLLRAASSSPKINSPVPAAHRDSFEFEITRRRLSSQLLFSLLALPAFPSFASDGKQGEYTQYLDEDDKFSVLIPPDWIKGTGKATGQRNVTAFFPADDISANVNILITGVGADYTSLSSFGTVDAFAENLVNSLDRSWKKPPGQIAKLVNCKSTNGLYYIEYTFQQPKEKKKHLLSVVGMRFNGWYNQLYTVTGQYFDDDQVKYGTLVEKAISSFKFI